MIPPGVPATWARSGIIGRGLGGGGVVDILSICVIRLARLRAIYNAPFGLVATRWGLAFVLRGSCEHLFLGANWLRLPAVNRVN